MLTTSGASSELFLVQESLPSVSTAGFQVSPAAPRKLSDFITFVASLLLVKLNISPSQEGVNVAPSWPFAITSVVSSPIHQ